MRKLATLAITALALLTAGCGGDERSEDAATRAARTAPTTTTTTTTAMTEPSAQAAGTDYGGNLEAATTAPTTAPTARPTTTAARPSATAPPTTAAPPATAAPATTTTTEAQTSSATITIAGFAFDPPVLRVARGTAVTATNNDAGRHTWTGDGWDSGPLDRGQSSTHTFTDAGTYAYKCTIHPSMTGSVEVS